MVFGPTREKEMGVLCTATESRIVLCFELCLCMLVRCECVVFPAAAEKASSFYDFDLSMEVNGAAVLTGFVAAIRTL